MRTIVLVLSLVALAVPSHAAPRSKTKVDDAASTEKKCHEMVGKEVREGTGENSRVGQLQVPQRWDLGVVLFEPVQQRPGLRSSLVVKAPGEGDGGVDDKAAQRRPSLIKSLILRPPSV